MGGSHLKPGQNLLTNQMTFCLFQAECRFGLGSRKWGLHGWFLVGGDMYGWVGGNKQELGLLS